MLRFVLFAAAIAAANAGIIEDFISGGKYINVAIKNIDVIEPAKLGTECSYKFIVTNTGEVDTCKGKSGLPIINFQLDSPDNSSFNAAMIAFDTAEERAAFAEGEVPCEKTVIKMLIIKPVNGINNIEMIGNGSKITTRGELLFTTDIPKESDLESYAANGFTLKCFVGIINDFVSGGKYVQVAIKDPAVSEPSKIGTECSHWFIVTNTGDIDTCKGKSGLPIINLKLDDPNKKASMNAAMIAFDSVEERDAFANGEVVCDKSLILMLILKPVDGFTNIEVISNEAQKSSKGELLFAPSIPKEKDLESYFSNGFSLECFEK